MSRETLDFEVRDAVAHLTLNRPDAANAIDLTLARELVRAAERCEEGDVRAVLVRGAGRMFCAGGDLASFAAAGDGLPALIRELADTLHEALARFARMDAPLVAAVNGAAAGAGMSLVVLCDFALAAESAKFAMAYTAAGLSPDGSSTWFLPRTIGVRRTKELMIANRRLSAAEAAEWGIVNRVVPDDALDAEAEKLARELAAGPTRSFGSVKRLLLASPEADLEAQLAAETDGIAAMSGTADGREGIAAFLEKRRPAFSGR